MAEDWAVIETPFMKMLEMMNPPFSGALDHPNFSIPLKKLQGHMEFLPQASIIFLVGPSHVGKSLMLKYGVRHVKAKVYAGVAGNVRPVFGATAMVSRDARTSPKYVLEELIFDLGNPFFDPLAANYRPGHAEQSEKSMLRTLRHGMLAMGARIAIVDEGDYLVRAKDESFRAMLLESIKGVVTPLTTLFIAGGYDLLETALRGRSHISSRKIVVAVSSYGDTMQDVREWRRIVSSMTRSERFSKESAAAIRASADRLRFEANGVIGILEKRMTTMLADAYAGQCDIDQAIIDRSAPTEAEWRTIRLDIDRGKELLKRVSVNGEITDKSSQSIPSKDSKKNAAAKPFVRSPKRQTVVPSA
jgi:hypothetical protein